MSLIQVDHLTFSYPGSFDNVFEDISFQFDTDWKLGFVGRNGRGKTTFLQLLLGRYEYSGTISASVPFDCFPYPVTHPEHLTQDILQEAAPQAEVWELLRELALLEVEEDVLYRPYETLSGGSGPRSCWRPSSSTRTAISSSTSPPTTWTPWPGSGWRHISGASGASFWSPTTAASWTAAWTTCSP